MLIIVAHRQVQKVYDAEPDEEKSDPLLLFREKFFKLQRDLIDDDEITYFEPDASTPLEAIAPV